MSASEWTFGERLEMSHGCSDRKDIAEILVSNIPGAVSAERSNVRDDRNGTDWWVTMMGDHKLSIDCKVRETDFAVRGSDDLALETYSVVEKNIAGWTRRIDKRTDYVLWLWMDTGRWCLVPFSMLCKVFSELWGDWREQYGFHRQKTLTATGQYHSECVFVPRKEVWSAIYRRFGGGPVLRA